jgi:hypothetical protein
MFENAFIIQLASAPDLKDLQRDARNHVATFRKRATSMDYSIRHEFHNPEVFLGLSIQNNGNQTQGDVYRLLHGIEGVVGVSSVAAVRIPAQQASFKVDPNLSYSYPPPLPSVADSSKAKLGSALEMGGVDKLHRRGIKGKGIKIGIIDTGVDYRHPALGAGFGPGHKIAGGHSFVFDNGTVGGGPDPLISCYGGGHGTHVAGLWSPPSLRIQLIFQESLEWTAFLAALILLELLLKHLSTCTEPLIVMVALEAIQSWPLCQKPRKTAWTLSACHLESAQLLSVERWILWLSSPKL